MATVVGKFVPSLGTVQSSPGDPLDARKAAGEWRKAARTALEVLAGGWEW